MKKLLCIVCLLASVLFVNAANAAVGSPMRNGAVSTACTTCGHAVVRPVATTSVVHHVSVRPVVRHGFHHRPMRYGFHHRPMHRGVRFGHRRFGRGFRMGRRFHVRHVAFVR